MGFLNAKTRAEGRKKRKPSLLPRKAFAKRAAWVLICGWVMVEEKSEAEGWMTGPEGEWVEKVLRRRMRSGGSGGGVASVLVSGSGRLEGTMKTRGGVCVEGVRPLEEGGKTRKVECGVGRSGRGRRRMRSVGQY
jgi:hypothetical protein